MLAEKGHGRVNSCPSQNVRRQDRRRKSLFQPGTSRLETCKNLPKKALEKQPFRIRKVRLKQLQRARPTQPQAGTSYSEFELLTQRGFLIQAPQGKKMGSVFLGSCHCQEKKHSLHAHNTPWGKRISHQKSTHKSDCTRIWCLLACYGS